MASDLDLLQGAWSVESLELDGNSVDGGTLSEARIEIKGNRFTSTGMGAVYAGTVKLDEAAKPRRIDLHFDSGPEAGNVNRGIYELTGGVWKLCLATRGDAWPSAFATEPGSGIALEILKRAEKAKAARKATAAAATAWADSGSAPATELEGEWQMIEAIINGARLDEASVQWVRRVNRANVTTVSAGPQTMLKAEFTYDPSQSPGAIDYLNLAGSNKGKRQQGIYSLKNGLLSISMAAPGAARPEDFQTAKGDGRTYTVWKRM